VKLRPRLIPAVILAATVLLGVKVSDIVSIGGTVNALAQAPAQAPATGAPVDLTKQANAATSPPPAAAQPNLPSGSQPAAAQADTAQPPTQTAEAPSTPPAAARAPLKDPLLLSPAEIEVLQQLSQRRRELDRRASEIDQQQVVLQAAEKRVDQKIAELQGLQKSIQTAVAKQSAAEDARTQRLVKIYETMKPKDAAQILSQLDMPITLELLSHMKELKTAPILAAMDPAKAEAITTALVQKQNQPAATPVSAAAPAPQP